LPLQRSSSQPWHGKRALWIVGNVANTQCKRERRECEKIYATCAKSQMINAPCQSHDFGASRSHRPATSHVSRAGSLHRLCPGRYLRQPGVAYHVCFAGIPVRQWRHNLYAFTVGTADRHAEEADVFAADELSDDLLVVGFSEGASSPATKLRALITPSAMSAASARKMPNVR
jgi:hypothetical protein